jgi:hypothetical protein
LTVATLVLLSVASAASAQAAALPAGSFTLYTGYADCPAGAAAGCSASTVTNPLYPQPWFGAPNVQFVGDPSQDNPAMNSDPDTSGIRLDNTGTGPLTLNDVSVAGCGSTPVDIWAKSPTTTGYPYTVASGQTIIFSSTSGDNFDGSEICAPHPTVTVNIGGTLHPFVDDLANGGMGGIFGGPSSDESTPWSLIGSFTAPATVPPVAKTVNSILPNLTCVDHRKFVIPVRQTKSGNGNVRRAVIYINHKKTKTVSGSNITSVKIVKLPIRGTYVVKVVTLTSKNFQITSTRTYKGCKKGQRSDIKHKGK